MIPDLDIYLAANAIVKQRGPDAPIHAAMRADARCATIVGDWEEPSGEARFSMHAVIIAWVTVNQFKINICYLHLLRTREALER